MTIEELLAAVNNSGISPETLTNTLRIGALTTQKARLEMELAAARQIADTEAQTIRANAEAQVGQVYTDRITGPQERLTAHEEILKAAALAAVQGAG